MNEIGPNFIARPYRGVSVQDAETLGGLLVTLLGVVPNAGESATFRGLRLTAQAVDERRVKELLVEVVKGRPTK